MPNGGEDVGEPSGEPNPGGPAGGRSAPPPLRAAQLLRIPTVWLRAVGVSVVLVFLMSLFYVGSIVNPVGHLRGLPVVLVDEDQGATVLGTHVDIGAQVADALLHTRAVTSRLSLQSGTLTHARSIMARSGAYATILIPPRFTSTLLAAYDIVPSRDSRPVPTVDLVTNPRAGSIGVELATAVSQPALEVASRTVGERLGADAAKLRRSALASIDPANPLTVATSEYRPDPPNSALGLSAFYISLLAIMCGFLGAILVHTASDSALGYSVTEIGPRWRLNLPIPISRSQTLLAKWAMALVVVPALTAVLLGVATGVLGMNAPHAWELWLFTSFAGVVIAAGTLVLLAALGSLGQMVAMLLFIYLALASSGGTIPLQALPGPLRFVASFEPLRQVLDGVRSILYFNGSGAAGLTRGLVLTSIGLLLWVVLGIGVTAWYDRRGLDRLEPELLEYVHHAAQDYSKDHVE